MRPSFWNMYKSMVVLTIVLFMTMQTIKAAVVLDQDYYKVDNDYGTVEEQDLDSSTDKIPFLSSANIPGLTGKNKLLMVPDIGSRIRKLAGLVRMVMEAQRDKDYELRRLSRLI